MHITAIIFQPDSQGGAETDRKAAFISSGSETGKKALLLTVQPAGPQWTYHLASYKNADSDTGGLRWV